MVRKAFFLAAVLSALLMLFSCAGEPALRTGLYQYGSYRTVDYAYINLTEDGKFTFSVSPAVSQAPRGTYSAEGDMLTLTAGEDEIYTFRIKKSALIFESGKSAEQFIPVGAEFKYTEYTK